MYRQSGFDWSNIDLDRCQFHTPLEPCLRCGHVLKKDPIGGTYLKCPNCGLETK